jgi:hypothetical protein
MTKPKDHIKIEPQQAPLIFDQMASSLEEAEAKALEKRFSGGQDFAESYLYVYPEKRDGKPTGMYFIGPGADFVRQIVSQVLNRSGRTQLVLIDQPPIVEDVSVSDRQGGRVPAVRVIVGSIDKRTGERGWGIKEEERNNKHCAAIALVKASRMAFENNPVYDRKLIARQIAAFLKRNGMDRSRFIITGGSRGGEWGALFGKAAAAGLPPGDVRAAVAESVGAGLSKVQTPEQVAQAARVVDNVVDTYPDRKACLDIVKNAGIDAATLEKAWAAFGVAGGLNATAEDWKRMRSVLELMTSGRTLSVAIMETMRRFPKETATAKS